MMREKFIRNVAKLQGNDVLTQKRDFHLSLSSASLFLGGAYEMSTNCCHPIDASLFRHLHFHCDVIQFHGSD